MADKTKHSRTSWSQLPIELFELILSKLSPGNILRLKAVCRPWLKAIKCISQSSPSFTCLPEPPRLLVFQDEDKDGVSRSGFYSLEGKFYDMPKHLCHGDSICIGSSHGWLLFLSHKKQLLLLNPVSPGIQLLLPPLNTFLYSIDPEIILRKSGRLWRRRMPKVALSSRPTCGNKNNIGVFLMYNYEDGCNCLAFCTPADNKWTKLDGQKRYLDVTSDGNCFYALNVDYSVEVWEFTNSSIPIKKLEIIIPAAGVPWELKGHSWFRLPCMAKTGASDLFLIQRVYSLNPQVVRFDVYKLEYNNRDSTCAYGWTKVESIGNYALVLGLNQSILISPQEFDHENSIYFTYAPSSNSCFLSVYNLREKEIKKVCDLGLTGVEQPVYWFEPSPLTL